MATEIVAATMTPTVKTTSVKMKVALLRDTLELWCRWSHGRMTFKIKIFKILARCCLRYDPIPEGTMINNNNNNTLTNLFSSLSDLGIR
jgi:hypothetical protein